MACSLETVEDNACASGIGEIEDQTRLLRISAQNMATWLAAISPGAEVTVEAIEERACESGIGKLEDQTRLLRITAANLCALSDS